MADDAATDDLQEPGSGDKGSGKMMSLLLLLAGLGMGSAGGLFFVGPLVAGPAGESSADAHAEDEADDGHGSAPSGGHGSDAEIGEDGVDPLLHIVSNVIVNPAGSGGSRFLLLDIAFRLSGEHAVSELAGRDPEIRDAILHMLGVRTVSELADISARDAMKRDIRELVSSILTSGTVTAVFLPRYVIQ